MKKLFTVLTVALLATVAVQAQSMNQLGVFDVVEYGDTTVYTTDQGTRTCWFPQTDMDGDGKLELLVTDYSDGGRVHCFEMNGDALEIVWSSPVEEESGGSVPRWVRTGDLDGDGNWEIIAPNGSPTQIEVFEYKGNDNDYGDQPAFRLVDTSMVEMGLGVFRMSRETALVEDFDGDGKSEAIFPQWDNNVYILGVSGQFPGFATWQVEGGDPAEVPNRRFSGGSLWSSNFVDFNGDGNMEITNHYWNFYGYWSIEVDGADAYSYPMEEGNTDYYFEYLAAEGNDAVAYMGDIPMDVDGDGNHEIGGVGYSDGYNVEMVNLTAEDDALYSWGVRDDQFGRIATELWTLAGKEAGSHWGTGAMDIDGDGDDEFLVGGSAGYHLTSLNYTGEPEVGVTDPANWEATILYDGETAGLYYEIDYYDSAGVAIDTVYRESPFVSKMATGGDMNSNGLAEVVLSYQSVSDSTTYTQYVWSDTVGVEGGWISDSSWKDRSASTINLVVLENDPATGIRELPLRVVTPEDYELDQNFPNPFNPSTSIRFALPVDKAVTLRVFDMNGELVTTLVDNEFKAQGAYEVTWNGTNDYGVKVASGNYIATLQFGNFQKSIKMQLLK